MQAIQAYYENGTITLDQSQAPAYKGMITIHFPEGLKPEEPFDYDEERYKYLIERYGPIPDISAEEAKRRAQRALRMLDKDFEFTKGDEAHEC
jgi:hypothetical protein